jgi:4-hydroxy-tetrahydrodipicolinate synthase
MKKGVFTALVTPFNNGEVDYDALKNNVEFQIDSGVSGLLALGTTGETPTLTEEEKKEIVRTVVKIANKKVEVMVGTGTNSTLKTINASKKAEEWGADILLVVTPYYNKPTDDGLFLHFKAVSDAVDIPIVVYNIQSRTGRNIETHLLKKICDECCNIIGVKEASGNICQMMDVIQKLPSDFLVYSGDDGLTLPLLSLGGVGVISVISNLFPKEVVEMVKYGLDGDFENARKMNCKLLPFVRAAFIETNPIPIKTAMAMKGMIKEEFRLPMCQITQKGREFLGKTLNQLDLGEPII